MSNTVQLTKDGQPVFPLTDVSVVTGIAEVAKTGDYDDLINKPVVDSVPTQGSTNPVTSGGIYNVIGDIETLLAAI